MAQLSYNELKIGVIFTKGEDKNPYKVLEYAFIRMQQRKPVTQLKIKNLISGKVQSYTAHQNENFKKAEIETQPVIFIYKNKNDYWFHETQDPSARFSLPEDTLGAQAQFLKPNTEIKAFSFNDKIIDIELPVKMDFKVIESPPAMKGNTAQGGTKQAEIETGVKITVPMFIEVGDIIRVNTQTSEYTERVEKN